MLLSPGKVSAVPAFLYATAYRVERKAVVLDAETGEPIEDGDDEKPQTEEVSKLEKGEEEVKVRIPEGVKGCAAQRCRRTPVLPASTYVLLSHVLRNGADKWCLTKGASGWCSSLRSSSSISRCRRRWMGREETLLSRCPLTQTRCEPFRRSG